MASNPERARAAKARYRERNREKVREKDRAYMARRRTDPEFAARERDTMRRRRREEPARVREIEQRYYAKHAEQRRAESAAYKAANPERVREWNKRRDPKAMVAAAKRWTQENPERARNNWNNGSSRRRARVRNANRIESIDRLAVYQRDNGKCHICGRRCSEKRFHVDHLVPLSKGGDHAYDNVAVAHPRCNLRRGAGSLPAQLRMVG